MLALESLKETIDIAKTKSVITKQKLAFLWFSIFHAPPGDIVEVGSYRGGSGLILATAAKQFKPTSKVYLCDTFKGIVLAGEKDNFHKNGDFNDTSIHEVNSLLFSRGLDNYSLVEGIFPQETSALVPTKNISVLHIDVDVYEGYKNILHWSKNKLVNNAIIILDDYGVESCNGATEAVKEFLVSENDFLNYHLCYRPFESSWYMLYTKK